MISSDALSASSAFDPPDPIPVSALQHWAYCPRQCGLIHLDQAFDDNLHTLRGNAVHANADRPGVESARGVRVERALPIWCDALGIVGKADTVEFSADGRPCPVEYKRGSRHKAADIARCDDIQVGAQAICLESMTGKRVSECALYYAASKRRRVVPVDDALRRSVAEAVRGVRDMLSSQRLPPPLTGPLAEQRCPRCSMRDRCQPQAFGSAALSEVRERLFDPES
jgi:CRISPR-associated exonuclease Cas4